MYFEAIRSSGRGFGSGSVTLGQAIPGSLGTVLVEVALLHSIPFRIFPHRAQAGCLPVLLLSPCAQVLPCWPLSQLLQPSCLFVLQAVPVTVVGKVFVFVLHAVLQLVSQHCCSQLRLRCSVRETGLQQPRSKWKDAHPKWQTDACRAAGRKGYTSTRANGTD